MCPCFSGVDLWILDQGEDMGRHQLVTTAVWAPLAWGRQLMRRDVVILFCAGIDQFLYGALRGCGIGVVPNAAGTPSEVLKKWQRGELRVPSTWPPHPSYRDCSGRRKRRGFYGGR